MENIGVSGNLVAPQDVPGEIAEWHSWATAIKNTNKHIARAAMGIRG
jgi:hypothetical protein